MMLPVTVSQLLKNINLCLSKYVKELLFLMRARDFKVSVHAYMNFVIEREIVRLTLFNIQFPATLYLHCIL